MLNHPNRTGPANRQFQPMAMQAMQIARRLLEDVMAPGSNLRVNYCAKSSLHQLQNVLDKASKMQMASSYSASSLELAVSLVQNRSAMEINEVWTNLICCNCNSTANFRSTESRFMQTIESNHIIQYIYI